MLERLLIENCSPTLSSLKSANLFTVHDMDPEELELQINFWNEVLYKKGISIILMKQKTGWALLYVCRKNQLKKRLENEEITAFLDEYGYTEMNVDAALERLKKRLNMTDGFPHEIGIFLDYPVEDVKGFIENAGRNYKCSGCWKVYCNECETVKLFAKYDKCKNVYRQLWQKGFDLLKLTVAA